MLHQAADQAERQDAWPAGRRGARNARQPVRATHRVSSRPRAACGMTFVAIVEQARIEPRLPDDRIGIDAEIAQGRRDLLGDAQVDVAG